MIGPGTGVRVYLACGVTDMRKGIAGLSTLAQDALRQKPTGGAVFAFRGRRGDRLKLLYWDGQGFCLSFARLLVISGMSNDAATLPDDPSVLKAMIAALQAENAKISATLRAHDQLVQALRLRIAKLQKPAFGASSEKIEQLELALEDLLVAIAEADTAPHDEDDTAEVQSPCPKRGKPNSAAVPVSLRPPCVSAVNWTPATPARTATVICVSWVKMSVSCSI